MADDITLTVDGMVYAGWESVRIMRGLDYASSEFDISVSERWAQQPTPWQIQLFQSATVSVGDDLLLSGFVERYAPSYAKGTHSVRIRGRSKTCDVVDSSPAIASSFLNQTLDKIAQAVAAPFGVNVVVQCDVGAPFPQAVMDKAESAHSFIERLARLRSVLVTDDQNGNVLITQAGLGGSSSTSLVEGQNILAASADLNCHDRFQTYAVLSQTPLSYDGEAPQVDVEGEATDPSCPRPRRLVEISEEAANSTVATARANWRKLHAYGKATQATITVQDWYQTPGGSLWQPNQIIPVQSPMLELDRSLLVARVTFLMDESGRRTELLLAPPEAYTLEPMNENGGGSDAAWLRLLQEGGG